jgi:hypothetical protein
MSNLNPFRWYENPYSYSTGNPLLTPSYINNYEISYTYNNKLSSSIYYVRLKNAFGQVSTLDGLSQNSNYLNHYNNNFYGVNLSYTDTFSNSGKQQPHLMPVIKLPKCLILTQKHLMVIL